MIPGYELIQELAHNDWQSLYRGRRTADQQSVLLKMPRRQAASAAELELLEREYALLRGLDVPGIPRPLALIRHAGECGLVLEDAGAMPLLVLRPCGLDEFFKLALPLVTLLGELHRREIIHQHLNPRSILLHPANGAVYLIDFSRATRGNVAQPPASTIPHFSNSLAYLAPEQTGRLNRVLDHRTDFYSLGVTFYELLTGLQPFCSTDALELIHWHIAKAPAPPAQVNPALPEPLSELVLKLLAKTAEDRYQSAAGLRADLEACAREWAAHGRIAPFTLGQHDHSERFIIPERLYGRAREVEQLLAAFTRVCAGPTNTPSLLLVTGYSGIGKTSLIQELHKPVAQRQGYFCSGKFDQYVRGVPFGALWQALRGLVRQLLSESEAQLDVWRPRLTEALGANGGVLAEVIPELELIIGKQPAPPELAPAEALNRFQLVIQKFVGALAGPAHPLVIFLDDLQWADAATLSLFEPLLTSPELPGLFLLGAYRDNEITASHPLARTLSNLEAAGGQVQRLTLEPLQLGDLTQLISDALYLPLAQTAPLAELVLAKTAGNPFFVSQFLQTLRQEGLVRFDYTQGRWSYSLTDIAAAPLTDNVIELMTRKLQRLSPKTQQALTLAACIGNPFDQQTLATVSQQTPEATADDLREALQEGLLLLSTVNQGVGEWGSGGAGERQSGPPPLSDQLQSYVFLHDRMQQAAYAMIPAEQRQSVHLTVGRLLRARGGPDELEEKLFDLVHHLNLGSSLIFTEAERLELARLNLRAGWKAKAATAFEAALGYFQAGARLLNEADWETSYDLAFALHLEAAECQPLCGQIAAAEQAFATLLNRARTPLDQAQVYRLRIILAETQSRYTEAIASARAALALFGVAFPAAELEQRAALEQEIETIQNLRGARQIAELVELPAMTDPAMRMVMSILMTVWSSAYIAGQQLLTRLLSATLVRLSLQHGNAEESAYGYATHTITVGPGRKDYAAAYEFGLLALRINERFNDRRRRAKIYQQFHAHANLWRQPWQSCLSYAREASRSGFETGDFTYGVYGAFTETWVALVCTPNLADYLREYAPNVALCQKLRMSSLGDAQQVLLHWARALRGETRQLSSLSDETFDEEQYWARYRDNAFFAICHLVTKLQLCYHSAAYDQALTLARLGRTLIQPLEGTLWPVVFAFWNGLTLAANYAGASPAERADFLAELAEARRLLTLLADHCPENYRCMALLLAAESERLNGQELKAAGLYEEAIRAAEMRGSPQQRALANELCAQFWAGRGQAKAAAVFLTEAREVYAQWGAAAKVVDLETRHAAVFNTPHVAGWSGESALPRLTEPGALDLFSVMKAAQAIAGEIELDKLLAKLLRIVIENAGAERGALLLEQGGAPHIYATGTLAATEVTVTDPPPLSPAAALPLNVINYVRRTAEDVVLADAAHTAGYGNDPYLRRPRPPRSLLCAPVRNQGRLLGVLYLENNLATGAFTPERLQVVQWLAAQAAVSLENARLYAEMKGEAESRQRAEQTLRSIMEGTAALTGGDFFASLVRHLAAALQVRFAFITECREPNKSQARTLAFWEGDRLAGNVTYEVAETPCLRVLAGETCYYPTGLQQHFPRDTGLVKMNAESYLGIPLRSSRGEVIGHLAVLDDKPLVQTPQSLSLLNIFAARAGAELERLHAEAELRVALAEVERLKNQLHAENLYLQEEIRREHNFEEIVGSSPALLETLHEVERIALADSTVLIYGETGTGKELIARALHDRSTRRNRPLVKVNCGAISAGLVESELFGHVKGAFTGALDRRVGRFELADGGTLFLDEVGELPLDTQTKLLRVLQEGEFEPVGSSKTQRVNVRIIAATNRKLEEEVRAGGFRADLFYRLNVLPLTLPPLRERRADIPALVAFFLARFAKKFGKSVEGVSQETMQLLVNYAWPGNIRELQNLIERGVALARHPILTIDPAMLPNTKVVAPRSVPAEAPARVEPVSQSASLDETQRQHILAVLRQTGGVIEGPKGAALILNLHPNTLRSRMKKLGIQRSQYVPQHSS